MTSYSLGVYTEIVKNKMNRDTKLSRVFIILQVFKTNKVQNGVVTYRWRNTFTFQIFKYQIQHGVGRKPNAIKHIQKTQWHPQEPCKLVSWVLPIK